MNPAQKMQSIFGGRNDSHGQDVAKDGIEGKGGMRVDAEVTTELFQKHLDGDMGLGIYPTWHDNLGILMASWGCADIDTGLWSEAYGLATALSAMGLTPHIERSRSKGWHIWCFPTEPVPAMMMRRAFKVAYAAIELPTKEINPKSEVLRQGQVGNYVRLPYKDYRKNSGLMARQTFLIGWDADGEGIPIELGDWLYCYDSDCETDAVLICDWGDRWREPKRTHIDRVNDITDEALKKLVGNLPGDLFVFVKNGPQADRSGGLVALAFKLRRNGYGAEEIYHIIEVADQQWGGKYADRPNASSFYMDIVERTL
jgi:hypothetical protein